MAERWVETMRCVWVKRPVRVDWRDHGITLLHAAQRGYGGFGFGQWFDSGLRRGQCDENGCVVREVRDRVYAFWKSHVRDANGHLYCLCMTMVTVMFFGTLRVNYNQ
jgi:hypothetical protein